MLVNIFQNVRSTNYNCFHKSCNKVYTVLRSHIITEISSPAVACLPLDFSPLHAYADSLLCFTLLTNVVKICNPLDDCHGYRAHLFQQVPFSWP